MSSLKMVSDEELAISRQIRHEVDAEILRQQLTDDNLAGRLNMLPSGVAVLRSRETWPIETALRMALALGMKVHFRTSND
jgi:hypothetical protein